MKKSTSVQRRRSTPSRKYSIVYETLRESLDPDRRLLTHTSLADAHEMRIAEAHARILLEKLDDEDMKKSKAILDKLKKIAGAAKAAKMESVETAIEAASKDLNDFLGGGIMAMVKRGISALAKKLGAEGIGENPLLKCATMLSALEDGFGKVSDVISMNLKDYDPKGKHKDVTPIQYAEENDKSALEKMTKTVIQAFVPGDFYSKLKSIFGSKTSIPYVDDAKALAADILGSTPEQLGSVIKVVTASSVAADAVDTAKDLAKTGKGGEGEGTGGVQKTGSPQPVKSTDDLAKIVAAGQSNAKDKDPGAALKAAADNPKKFTSEFIKDVAERSKQDADVVNKIVSALLKAGKLKSEFKVTEESRSLATRRNTAVLTLNDVKIANDLYLESGGSSRKWISLLIEREASKESYEEVLKSIESGEIKSAEDFKSVITGMKLSKAMKKDLARAFKEKNSKSEEKSKEGQEEKPKPSPEAAQAADAAAKQAEELQGKESIDVADAKKALEDMLGDIGRETKALKDVFETNEKRGVGDKDLAEFAVEQLKTAEEMINKLISAQKATPKEIGEASKSMISAFKACATYTQMAANDARKKDKEKTSSENEKVVKDLEDELSDLAARVRELTAEKESANKAAQEKYGKLADEISASLKDVEPTAIVSVLAALPKYMVAEAARKRRLLESRRVQSRRTV